MITLANTLVDIDIINLNQDQFKIDMKKLFMNIAIELN